MRQASDIHKGKAVLLHNPSVPQVELEGKLVVNTHTIDSVQRIFFDIIMIHFMKVFFTNPSLGDIHIVIVTGEGIHSKVNWHVLLISRQYICLSRDVMKKEKNSLKKQ